MVPENSTDFLFQPDIMYSIWTSVSIPVMVVRANDLIILEANPPARNTFSGISPELNGKRIDHLGLWPESAETGDFLKKFREDSRIENYELCLKTGKEKASDFLINTDTMEVAGVRYKLMMMRDITELKVAERSAKEKELLFESAVNNLSEMVVIHDNGKIIFGNGTFKKTFGVSDDDFLGRNIQEYIRLPKFENIAIPDSKALLESGKTGLLNEIKISQVDGPVRYYTFNTQKINYTEHEVLMTILIDITQRKCYEQAMMAKALESVERERNMLVEKLHDDLGPDMSTIMLLLSSIDQLARDNEPVGTRLAQCLGYMDHVIMKLKSITADISPDAVDRFGLDSSLRALIGKLTANKALSIDVKSNIHDLRFLSNVEINVYRIVSELIENTVQHSGANRADLRIKYGNGELLIIYKDNGKGFDVKSISLNNAGSGILNIINRVNSLNGKIDFKQNEGHVITVIKVKAETVR